MRTQVWALLAVAGCFVSQTAAGHPRQGFLYGTVETRSGQNYTGVIRWGKEESFWDDHFNSVKEDLPYREVLPPEERRRRKSIKVLGIDVDVKWEGDYVSRQFVARFGDIVSIVPTGKEGLDVHMKGGVVERVNGGSNDIGIDITVNDESLGEVMVPWDRIERVTFRATPSNVDVPALRLAGDVATDAGEFTGFIQWDSDECLSTDKLDGESEDGKVSIPFGKIRSIARSTSSRSRVTLTDGRELSMSGSNDVDESIRGILVEDPRYGRVKIGWGAFQEVTFRESRETGRSYDEYSPSHEIRGRVTDTDGKVHSGLIVIDLDETQSWEFLNGSDREIDYLIPLASVQSIEPGRRGSVVVLRGGAQVDLSEGKDVSDESDGVLIRTGGKNGTYLAWDEVERIDLD
jgi:hypothetical protein